MLSSLPKVRQLVTEPGYDSFTYHTPVVLIQFLKYVKVYNIFFGNHEIYDKSIKTFIGMINTK